MIRDSNWSFHEPYFSKNHIFHEPYRLWNIRLQTIEHKIIVLKLKNKNQIIWQCHIFFKKHSYRKFPASSIDLSSKSFVNTTFYGVENGTIFNYTIHYSNLYFIFHFLIFQQKVFHKIMQQMFFNHISRYIKIHSPYPSPNPLGSLTFFHRINTWTELRKFMKSAS